MEFFRIFWEEDVRNDSKEAMEQDSGCGVENWLGFEGGELDGPNDFCDG